MKNKNLFLIFGIVLLVLFLSTFAGARDFNIYNTSNSAQSYFMVSGTSGNVGIGTTSPTTNLYVNGSATATTYYGDGSQLTGVQVKQMIESFVVQGGQSVSAGDVVSFINGNIQKGIIQGNVSMGTNYTFNSASSQYISASKLNSTSFVVAYEDAGNSYYGTALIGTVSGSTITFGSKYVFNTATTQYISVSGLNSTSFVVAYEDLGNSNHGTAMIGTVSGTTISYGSKYMFEASYTDTYISVSAFNSTKFIVAYNQNTGGSYFYGYLIVGLVSGSTISYGGAVSFVGGSYAGIDTYNSVSASDLTNFVFGYQSYDASLVYDGMVGAGSVSGTTITVSSQIRFNSGQTNYVSISGLTPSQFVIAYSNSSNIGLVSLGTVSGGSVSVQSGVIFSSYTGAVSISALSPTNFIIGNNYFTSGAYNFSAVMGTVSGSTISLTSEVKGPTAGANTISVLTLNSTNFVGTYPDSRPYGSAVVGQVTLPSNYVGIAQASGSAGQTVPVIVGGVADVFSGLTSGTTYYADTSGNLTSSGGVYRVGLAISSSKILLNSDQSNTNQFFGDMIFANQFRITEGVDSLGSLIFKNPTGNAILNLNSLGDLKIPGNLDVNNLYAKGKVVLEKGLEVKGTITGSMIQLIPTADESACDSTTEGGIYFNKNDKNFYGCDGNKWSRFSYG